MSNTAAQAAEAVSTPGAIFFIAQALSTDPNLVATTLMKFTSREERVGAENIVDAIRLYLTGAIRFAEKNAEDVARDFPELAPTKVALGDLEIYVQPATAEDGAGYAATLH